MSSFKKTVDIWMICILISTVIVMWQIPYCIPDERRSIRHTNNEELKNFTYDKINKEEELENLTSGKIKKLDTLKTPNSNKINKKEELENLTSGKNKKLDALQNPTSNKTNKKEELETPTSNEICHCYKYKDFVRPKETVTKKGVAERYNKLSKIVSHKNEISILKRLNQVESKCIRHWPILKSFNDQTFRITTTWDGFPLNTPNGMEEFCNISVQSIIDQGRCIDNHLIRSNVTHNDQMPNGKNVLIYNGHLTLFDFNIATLDGYPILPKNFQPYQSVLEHLLALKFSPMFANCSNLNLCCKKSRQYH